jgi:5-formyltetrahydrofolate cyclo-ligase
MNTGIDAAKQAVRARIWGLLERERVVERGVHGYIPAFAGADVAADRLAQLPVWRAAGVIKAVPDRAQQPVRERALRDGKLLYMAVPMLADDLPFYVLDPSRLPMAPSEAAVRQEAARVAPKIAVDGMQPVDMVVCGSVAVNRAGVRLGKGAGYSDIEVALLQDRDRDDRAPVAGRRRSPSGDEARLQRRSDRDPGRSDRLQTPAASWRPLLGTSDRRQDRRYTRAGREGRRQAVVVIARPSGR